MVETSKKMLRKKEKAIACLITQPTITLAAQEAGISQSTMFRWLNDSEFQADFRKAKKEIVGHALTQVQRSVTKAVETLLDVMGNGVVESAKVSAAKTILELAIRAVEIEDLEERLEALEERMMDDERH